MMESLKIAAFVCLLATAECADITTYDGVCVGGTDTCSFTNTACIDRDENYQEKCGCIATQKENAGANGCEAAAALDAACTANADCIWGATCQDLNFDTTAETCLCGPSTHAQSSACVRDPGTTCTAYGLPCTENSACTGLTGKSTVPTVCVCNTGYYSDGVRCVAGARFLTASTLLILATFVASRLFF